MLAMTGGLGLVLVAARPAAAVCAAQTERRAFRHAEVVLEGVMLPGPTVEMGDLGAVLRSDARLRVERYRKGEGPTEVRVPTAVIGPGNGGRALDEAGTSPVPEVVGFVEDRITPAPGERWVIYGQLRPDGLVATSTCAGSHRLGEPGPFVEPGVTDVIRDEQLLWGVAVGLTAVVALVAHRRSTRVGVRNHQ